MFCAHPQSLCLCSMSLPHHFRLLQSLQPDSAIIAAGSLESCTACTCKRVESTGGLCPQPFPNHSQAVCSLQALQLGHVMHAESCEVPSVLKPFQARQLGSILHSVCTPITATDVQAALGFQDLHLRHAAPADTSVLLPQVDPLQAWQRISASHHLLTTAAAAGLLDGCVTRWVSHLPAR